MKVNAQINKDFSVSGQITVQQVAELHALGYRTLICNRPDGEGADQATHREIADAAMEVGIELHYIPVVSGAIDANQVDQTRHLLLSAPKPILAYCRTGMRSISLWALACCDQQSPQALVTAAQAAGYDLSGLQPRLIDSHVQCQSQLRTDAEHTVVIVGGGAAGIAVAASLLARNAKLNVAIIDPAENHYYQPGWTLVGAGVFNASQTVRQMAKLIPKGVHWIKAAVAAFDPANNAVILEGCRVVRYQVLVVCPGLKLDWNAISGLAESLGKNGVTSNYRFDLAPYTWKLTQQIQHGRALFTQPPMPIKCAGAPQKALYLACDYWRKQNQSNPITVEFYNAGAVLFGVPDYVPALMKYIERYQVRLNFAHKLSAVDGARRVASFIQTLPDGSTQTTHREFDFLHAVPPQCAPDFVKFSPLADASGWLDLKADTLQHRQYSHVFGLGDVGNTPNAKTAAAARKQAPVVAHNIINLLRDQPLGAIYDGYGSCPLTVERGKVVLAEFAYGGKLMPSFPRWLLDGRQPSRLAWQLKEQLLPPLYWQGMLKGREWLAEPELTG